MPDSIIPMSHPLAKRRNSSVASYLTSKTWPKAAFSQFDTGKLFSSRTFCTIPDVNANSPTHYKGGYIRWICGQKDVEEGLAIGKVIVDNFRNGVYETDKDIRQHRDHLSALLYLQSLREDKVEFWTLFNDILELNIAVESVYTLGMRLYADEGDLKSVNRLFTLMKNGGIKPHARSYVPFLYLHLQEGNYMKATEYLDKIKKMETRFSLNLYKEILRACVNARTENNHVEVSRFADDVFKILENMGTLMTTEMIEIIKEWFEKDSRHDMQINMTHVNKSGFCLACKTGLKRTSIPEQRMVRLKQNLLSLIKASIIQKHEKGLHDEKPRVTEEMKTMIGKQSAYFDAFSVIAKSKTSPKVLSSNEDYGISDSLFTDTFRGNDQVLSTLKGLRDLLNEQGPFDVVIDGLNCGYLQQGFSSVEVFKVVSFFLKQKKRILVMCAGPLKERLLTSKAVAPADQSLQKLMRFMERTCTIFFAGSSIVDDYYLLYSLVHHNFDVKLVSRDMFRDHLFHMNSQSVADFKRWQGVHQYVLKAFDHKADPVFKARPRYDIAVQREGDSWHFPTVESGRKWLCVDPK